jgi:hypothetical protein
MMKRITILLAAAAFATVLFTASIALAGDAEMKQQLVGTWEGSNGGTITFTADGKWFSDSPDERWDIRAGKLIEIKLNGELSPHGPYTILRLTADEFIIQEDTHGQNTFRWIRSAANNELPRLHWKVSEAEKALFTDLQNLSADKYIADCPDEDQMAKIHQDEKLLDEAVQDWEKANN